MFGKYKYTPLSSLFEQANYAEKVKRAKILVIDDEEACFPCKLLRSEGYNIEYISKVESLKPLVDNSYDIIILDLNGVAAEEITENDGFGVLTHIKEYNPSQIVVAYSAKKYDLNSKDFWELADAYLGKPSPLDEFQRLIDNLLHKKFNGQYYWDVLKDYLKSHDVSDKHLKKLEGNIIKNQGDLNDGFLREKLLKSLPIAKDSISIAANMLKIVSTFLLKTNA